MKYLGFPTTRLFWKTTAGAAGKAIIILAVGAVFLHIALWKLGGKFQTDTGWENYVWDVLNGSIIGSIGASEQRAGWSQFGLRLVITGGMVLIALVWSTLVSFLLGFKMSMKPHSRVWDLASHVTSFASGFPLFIVGIIVFQLLAWILYDPALGELGQGGQGISGDLLIKMLVGGLCLGSFEGILGDWPRSIRSILSNLQDRAYYLACRARGQSTRGIIWRTIRPFFLDGLPTRISYLFGASAIIEHTLSIRGLGVTLLEAITGSSPHGLTEYRDAMVAGTMMILIPLILFVLFQILRTGYSVKQA